MIEEFTDPIVRCTDCQRITMRDEIRKFKMCPDCGNKRFKNVLVLSKKEMDSLQSQGIDAEFLALFEAVD